MARQNRKDESKQSGAAKTYGLPVPVQPEILRPTPNRKYKQMRSVKDTQYNAQIVAQAMLDKSDKSMTTNEALATLTALGKLASIQRAAAEEQGLRGGPKQLLPRAMRQMIKRSLDQ